MSTITVKPNETAHSLAQFGRTVCIALVRFYQLYISPLKSTKSCDYVPTCSEYAIEAINKFGVRSGLKLALGRLSRCHPWHPCGFDPVPETLPTQAKPNTLAETRTS